MIVSCYSVGGESLKSKVVHERIYYNIKDSSSDEDPLDFLYWYVMVCVS